MLAILGQQHLVQIPRFWLKELDGTIAKNNTE